MLHYLEQAARERVSETTQAVVKKVEGSRRSFLKGGAALTGLVVALHVMPKSAAAFKPYNHGGHAMPHGVVADPNVFVSIAKDGTVTIVAHRSEMGTGSRTYVPMIIAEELDADWSRVKIVQAEGDEPKYGNQDTDGSRSLRHHVQPARIMGASVRHMLVSAAVKQWGVARSDIRAANHEIVHVPTGRKVGYGDLAEAAMQETVPVFDALDFKDEADFRYVGKGEIQLYDLHDITTGKAVYGADIIRPGMKFAAVARPPVLGATVKSHDASAAMKIKGVEKVVPIPGANIPAKFAPMGGLAVVATSTWAAIKGRDALVIEWSDSPHAGYDSDAYHKEMSANAKQPGKVLRAQGDTAAAFKNAAKVVSAEYYQPHMAHVAMEPLVAVADVKDGKAEIWGPLQSPYGARQDIAAALEMDEADVTTHVTLLGGGFGRKSQCDFAIEAAHVSKAVGAPIKLQWTREDDIRNAFYHTTSVERIEAAVDSSNKVVGWRHNSVAPSILSIFAPDSGHQFFIEAAMGHVDNPFEIANMSIENGKAMAHNRVAWFRSVSNVPRAFAVQSFVGELAHELGKDPKDMLLELIGSDRIIDPKLLPKDHWNYGEPYDEFPIDTARLKNVVRLAADKAGWGKKLPKGEALGIAAHRSFVSYIASVVHVKIADDGSISVPEVHTAIDCGFTITPERVAAQVEGSAVFGMTLALYSAITYKNGAVEQSNYHDYEMSRMNRFPEKVHTHIVPHKFETHATGVGEPALPPFAPALANAIFAATGKRLRDLPFGEKV
ncbi:MAG: molybdopterin-dependent oxidoreductase [Alphaproteobacteria bacterium]